MKGEDFYFQVSKKASGTFFLITPRGYYDAEGVLSDESGVADKVVPEGFYELAESTYQYKGEVETGKQLLLEIGMTEIDFGFDDPVTPNENFGEELDRDVAEEQDIDYLLNKEEEKIFNYSNTSTDKLLRHLKIMLMSDSFEEAAKIRDELNSRGVTEF